MKTSISEYEFCRWFEEQRPNNFSRVGLQSLFDYLEEYEESTGEEIEFDPIALCCEYTEYEDLDEFHQDYDKEEYPDLDEIRDWTQVIEVGNKSFIIQQF
tara:strand:+ start:6720 stop:7019 length:300 start_codon:yes stop_codon:yes gene_type:complete